ncbi:MAG TPA: hypothetical protein VGE63_02890 [Candidatus Paceibacterota bacterium]
MNSPLDYLIYEHTGMSAFPKDEAEEIFPEIAFTVYNEALEKFLEQASEEEANLFEQITEEAKDEDDLFKRLSAELPKYIELLKTTAQNYKEAVSAYKDGGFDDEFEDEGGEEEDQAHGKNTFNSEHRIGEDSGNSGKLAA